MPKFMNLKTFSSLQIILFFKNFVLQSGNYFREAVYNETVQVIELEEGMDGETFFLYLFMAACMVLLLVGGQQFLVSVGKKRGHISRKPQVETGTNDNPNDVNYDWLPKDALKSLSSKKLWPLKK